ncbi:CDP-alcohol phosphatidyltransferase family protein [Frondihabitans australicus]|uniref:Phosphatidylglycerophosphate synthase n=1 Tax=Frondihabitans australicus TaxID=386892 RepID=A0A495IIW8_9MICO|nr:CDP-alcohol phosphatidyltransferase family protein [Frondihabitans australicus]RKR75251.1 phosphatidylglycerophosphate synthase [Frondihabitans australicus]
MVHTGSGAIALVVGAVAAATCVAVAGLLLTRGLRRRGARRLGAANTVTSVRALLGAGTTGLVGAGMVVPVAPPILLAVVVPALLLDGLDGWVARRTGTVSELGARYDMEVDAFLLLVLSVDVARDLGPWVLAIGLMRYAFVAASWLLPWMGAPLPFRYWRKVAAAAQGVALAVAASRLLPGLDVVLVALALSLLVESFGRDVLWLARRRPSRVARRLGAWRRTDSARWPRITSRSSGTPRSGPATPPPPTR